MSGKEVFNRSDCCIIYNRNSGRGNNERKANRLSRKLGGVEIFPVEQYGQEDVSSHKIQIIFSGDGTISSIAHEVLASNQRPLIVLAGGGSENQLYKTLARQKNVIKTEELFSVDDLEVKTGEYRPAVVSDHGEFLVNGGFGNIETTWAKNHDMARQKVPARLASYYSYIKGLFQLYPNLTFKMVLINNPTASLKLPKDVTVSREELLEIEIEGKPAVRLLKAIIAPFLWKTGIPIPKGIFKTTIAEELKISADKDSDFTLDGECFSGDGLLTVRRSKEHLRLMVLKVS